MKKNFIIDQAVYILNEQHKCYDLHNNYHFHQCTMIPSKATVILIWLRLDREWIQDEQPKEVVINFKNISFFKMSDNILNDRVVQIQEMGYKMPDDNDLDWLDNEEHFSDECHMIFRFENDEFIRIQAEFAEVKEA